MLGTLNKIMIEVHAFHQKVIQTSFDPDWKTAYTISSFTFWPPDPWHIESEVQNDNFSEYVEEKFLMYLKMNMQIWF